jgi:hypothetical protein
MALRTERILASFYLVYQCHMYNTLQWWWHGCHVRSTLHLASEFAFNVPA